LPENEILEDEEPSKEAITNWLIIRNIAEMTTAISVNLSKDSFFINMIKLILIYKNNVGNTISKMPHLIKKRKKNVYNRSQSMKLRFFNQRL